MSQICAIFPSAWCLNFAWCPPPPADPACSGNRPTIAVTSRPAPAVLSLQQPDSVELDFTGCGNQTILAAMEGQPPFTITSIVPNPAGASLRVQGIGYRV